jgi:hypothetical protein
VAAFVTISWLAKRGSVCFTPTSHQSHTDFTSFPYLHNTKVISIPFKIEFMKWRNKRQQEKKNSQSGKWRDDE